MFVCISFFSVENVDAQNYKQAPIRKSTTHSSSKAQVSPAPKTTYPTYYVRSYYSNYETTMGLYTYTGFRDIDLGGYVGQYLDGFFVEGFIHGGLIPSETVNVRYYDYNEDYRSSIVFAEADIPCAIHWSMSSNIAPSSATVAISGINVKNFMSLISIIA